MLLRPATAARMSLSHQSHRGRRTRHQPKRRVLPPHPRKQQRQQPQQRLTFVQRRLCRSESRSQVYRQRKHPNESIVCVTHSFVGYIDEAGDEGFKFDKGSTEWFVLSCMLISKEQEPSVVKLIEDVGK